MASHLWRGAMQRIRGLRQGTPRRLSPAEVAKFDQDGFLLPLVGCSGQEASEYLARIEEGERISQKGGMALYLNAHLQYKWWYDLCTSPAILGAVEDLIGPNILIWKSQLWIKEPGPAFVGWHQDATYWGLEPPDSVNVWLALTDVTETHGPLELLAESQAGPLPTRDTYEVNNILTRGQDVDFEAVGGLDRSRVRKAILKPGEFSLHHLCTAHSSRPNDGPGRRIGFNVTFVAPHVSSIRPDGASAMLVKGTDPFSNYRLEKPPSGDVATPAEAQAAREKNEGVSRSLLAGADMEKFEVAMRARAFRNLPSHVKEGGAGAFAAGIESRL